MKFVYAATTEDDDSTEVKGIYDNPREAFIAAGYIDRSGKPRSDVSHASNVRVYTSFAPGEMPIDRAQAEDREWERVYTKIYYLPMLLARRSAGEHLRDSEIHYLKQAGLM